MNAVALSNTLSKKLRFASDLSPLGCTGCLVWTGGTNGRGGLWAAPRRREAEGRSVAAMELAGIQTPQGCQRDHLRGRRTCINVRHLEPVTGAENVRRGACAKLTPEQVAEIRALYDTGRVRNEIAATYGVTRQQIYDIGRGRRWGGSVNRQLTVSTLNPC